MSVICTGTNGFLIITNSWYVVAIIVFYTVFYFSFIRNMENMRRGIIGCAAGIILYIIVGYFLRVGAWWYYSSLAFLVGIIFAMKELKVSKNAWIVAEILFFLAYVARYLNSRFIGSAEIVIIACLMASAVFPVIVFGILQIVSINNKYWRFLGSISFEIYLWHELVYKLLRNDRLFEVLNDFIYVALSIIISVFCAWGFHKLYTAVKMRLRK